MFVIFIKCCFCLSGRLNFDICFLSLSATDLSDQDLAEQLRATPPESIVVLEVKLNCFGLFCLCLECRGEERLIVAVLNESEYGD
jgi:hypothetical protein